MCPSSGKSGEEGPQSHWVSDIRRLIEEYGPHAIYQEYPLMAAGGTVALAIAIAGYWTFGEPVKDVIRVLSEILFRADNIWTFLVPKWIRSGLQNPIIAILVVVSSMIAGIRINDGGVIGFGGDIRRAGSGLSNAIGLLFGGLASGLVTLGKSDFISGVLQDLTATLVAKLILALGGAAAIAWIVGLV